MSGRSTPGLAAAVRAGADALDERAGADGSDAAAARVLRDLVDRLDDGNHFGRKDVADAIRGACSRHSQDGSYQYFWDIANELDPPADDGRSVAEVFRERVTWLCRPEAAK